MPEAVFRFAHETGCILVTRNRDDFSMVSSSSSGATLVAASARRCTGCSNAPEKHFLIEG